MTSSSQDRNFHPAHRDYCRPFRGLYEEETPRAESHMIYYCHLWLPTLSRGLRVFTVKAHTHARAHARARARHRVPHLSCKCQKKKKKTDVRVMRKFSILNINRDMEKDIISSGNLHAHTSHVSKELLFPVNQFFSPL